MEAERLQDLIKFYNSMNRLEHKIGGRRMLSDCHGRMKWPKRGIYFFMEDGEQRMNSGQGPRIVRVGTHAVSKGSKTTLWQRLSQHKGTEKTGGGNHRGSIFRKIVGTAVDNNKQYTTWGQGQTAPPEIRAAEIRLEQEVSQIIRSMPFLWLEINDEASSTSLRSHIEMNAIALLSNTEKEPLDPPSKSWLGYRCAYKHVHSSGLWNQNYVDKTYAPEFLNMLDRLIDEMEVL